MKAHILVMSVCFIVSLPALSATQSAGVLLATDLESHQVLALSLDSPGQIQQFTSGVTMDYLRDMAVGPDGHLYVADGHYEAGINRVLRFDGRTGVFTGVFTDLGRGGWDGAIAFGPDNNLYAVCWDCTTVSKYDGKTGQLLSHVIVRPFGTNDCWIYAIAAGPDGFLYVAGDDGWQCMFARFAPDGSQFTSWPSPGMSNGPRKPAWGPDGNFYSANLNEGLVRRYSGATGQFLDVFTDPPEDGSVAVAFGGDGQLYTSGVWNKTVFRANGTNGAYLGILATNVCVNALIPVPPPYFTKQPAAVTACEGGVAAFKAEVSSALQPSFQWCMNGAPIPAATNATLRLTSLCTNDAGDYSVLATNIGGSVLSELAHLTVTPPARIELTIRASGFFEVDSVRITDESPAIYAIEASTNLVDWEMVNVTTRGITVRGGGSPSWSDRRFYRARLVE